MSGFVLRGALVSFMDTFPVPIPNVIVFQYNPESMTHSWTPASPTAHVSSASGHPLAITGEPEESFSFTLAMNSNDTIADGDPVSAKQAELTGVYPRLAALEMLLFPSPPQGGALVGTVSAALASAGGASGPTRTVPAATLPVAFLVYGPGRILPVRLASLSITEKLYDPLLLNPIYVEAQLSLRVLTQEELQYITGKLGAVAAAAYSYTQNLRQTLAVSNLVSDAASIIGMLPV
jgi:hypothetical protein